MYSLELLKSERILALFYYAVSSPLKHFHPLPDGKQETELQGTVLVSMGQIRCKIDKLSGSDSYIKTKPYFGPFSMVDEGSSAGILLLKTRFVMIERGSTLLCPSHQEQCEHPK